MSTKGKHSFNGLDAIVAIGCAALLIAGGLSVVVLIAKAVR